MAYASVDIAELSVLIGLPIEIDDNVHFSCPRIPRGDAGC